MSEEWIEIPFEGQRVKAKRVAVVNQNEPFAEYLLEDGARLRLKAVAVDVLRVKDRYDGEGNPTYVVKSKGVMYVDAPPELRKQR